MGPRRDALSPFSAVSWLVISLSITALGACSKAPSGQRTSLEPSSRAPQPPPVDVVPAPEPAASAPAPAAAPALSEAAARVAPLPSPPPVCFDDMILIEGSFCTEVVQTCEKHRHPWQCAVFASPTVCKGKEEARRYCIDTYEFPNKKGGLPVVMQTWYDAKTTCESQHKRLCTDSEWTLACEGPERLPFPYGYERDASLCAIDKPSLKVDEKKLFSKKHGREEVARLDQREPSGAREKCVSAYGVHDLTGNVDEWVVNETGHPFRSSLKGGNWGEYRNACRPATRGHAEGFRYYQMGFRCCADAEKPIP